ncbi:hypothetical protein [Sulfitobacter donghicola]|uniref:Uncharacterized protein n=1 Tax=Sulfitobacter donghicola DSW-25 = KCTC 12864 = JCM 14565 TaxID=1300350 RepID=A0A073IEB0_9RHOB|nr:hypothetical protein [Sulfitobacter donghicola]KEJ88039.1 hypothetical protein DSW25_17355 [Sulfitobacter donghicola DSW-25 = KCTC 12864 = JCM 14565]
MLRLIPALVFILIAAVLSAQQTEPETPEVQQEIEGPMTMERLATIVTALDPEVTAQGPTLQFHIDNLPVMIVADPVADRMRALVPIASAEGLSEKEMLRMMQANFDAALDARYAIANGRLWGVFIHPLSPLKKDQLISGLVQTVTVARTYGTAFTGGGAIFGGGDTGEIYRNLLEDLRKKGEAL